jgi:hypothetical protein
LFIHDCGAKTVVKRSSIRKSDHEIPHHDEVDHEESNHQEKDHHSVHDGGTTILLTTSPVLENASINIHDCPVLGRVFSFFHDQLIGNADHETVGNVHENVIHESVIHEAFFSPAKNSSNSSHSSSMTAHDEEDQKTPAIIAFISKSYIIKPPTNTDKTTTRVSHNRFISLLY